MTTPEDIVLVPDPDMRSKSQKLKDEFASRFQLMMQDPDFRRWIAWKKAKDEASSNK